jgi:hypothetical protein
MYRQSSKGKSRKARKLFGLGVFIFVVHLLMASSCGGTGPNPVPDFSLSVGDVTIVKLLSGAATGQTTVTINRTGSFSDAVSLSVSNLPAGVTPTFSETAPTGNTSTLTLSVADTTSTGNYNLTVTGTAGSNSKTDSFSLTVNPALPPATITVAGQVLDLAGTGLSGVTVRVVDQDGDKTLVVTDGSGNFSVPSVKTPYSVSAVLPSGTLLPQTWDGVTRSDPKLVMFDLALSALCTRADGFVDGSISPAVGVGNTAEVYFISEGISVLRLLSSETDSLIAGDTSYSVTVSFDSIMCETVIAGKLVYLERNGAGDFVRSAVYDVSVTTGNTTTRDISTVAASSSTLKGDVAFPTGVASATVSTIMRFGDAYAILPNDATVTPASSDYEIVIPNIAGISYRTLAIDPANSRWAYSDVLAPGATANLTLPNLSTTVSPSGPVATTFPTFTQTPVAAANLYVTYVSGGGKNWIGSSQSTSIKLPDLPNPARLDVGGAYNWQSINAVKFRNASSVNDLLDGRLTEHFYLSLFAIYNPEQIESGSFNSGTTAFNIP